MQLLYRIWDDVRRGDNIDLYATITVALGLVILNLIGFNQQTLIAPITLAVLGLLSIAILGNRYRVQELLQKMSQMPAGLASGVKIYEHWRAQEVHDILRSAKSAVVIIDSWIGEATTLAGCIRDASIKASGRLTVHIYVLDPVKPFGAQRRAEYEGVFDSVEKVWRDRYEIKYQDSIEALQSHLSKLNNINLNIYTYTTMPEIRLYIVDDEEFVFSWFPVDSPSSDNVCFHLSENFANRENRSAIEKLRNHFLGVHKASQKVDLSGKGTIEQS